jgi:hypothetical protein
VPHSDLDLLPVGVAVAVAEDVGGGEYQAGCDEIAGADAVRCRVVPLRIITSL